MSSTYVVGVRIDGSAAGYLRATQQAQGATRGFVASTRREFEQLKGFMRSYQGQLASLGVGVGFVSMAKDAAKLQRTLTQVALTAGMSAAEQSEAYKAMFDLVKKNGGVIEETVGGFNNLIQAGLKYKEAMEATKAVSLAQTVTGADPRILSGALTVGAASFNFDLSKMGVATEMLDKMTVSGRLGNAELENLSNIFPRVANGAKAAGMDFDKTLSFVQALSMTEKQPERLATLADSTTRLFTNLHYAKDAERALGVAMFNKDKSRRDPIAVLEDMRTKFRALKTDADRFKFMGTAFGKADLDTQRGLASLFGGDLLEKWKEFSTLTKQAAGTLASDAPRAMANAATQAERLRNTLRMSAEEFAAPINGAVAHAIKYMLDAKKDGGLEMTGGQVAAGGAVAAAGVYALSRIAPSIVSKVLGRTGGVAAGVAEGKALQAAANVMPVYVVNWAEMNGGGGSAVGALGGAAAGAGAVSLAARLRNMAGVASLLGFAPVGVAGAGAVAAGAGLAGAAGYGVGTGIYKLGLEGNKGGDIIGESIARVLATFGNEEAQRSLAVTDALKNAKVGGELTVRVVGAPGLSVQTDSKPLPGTRINTSLGQTNLGAGL